MDHQQNIAAAPRSLRNVDIDANAKNKLSQTKWYYDLQKRAGHCSRPFELESYRFFGHIMRRDSLQRDLIEGMVEGKRGRGKPILQLSDNITQWTGLNFVDAKRAA